MTPDEDLDPLFIQTMKAVLRAQLVGVLVALAKKDDHISVCVERRHLQDEAQSLRTRISYLEEALRVSQALEREPGAEPT